MVQEHYETDADYDLLGLAPGYFLKTHSENVCGPTPYPCCVHKPSQHALNQAPLNWRPEKGLMERQCEHETWHPDPDDLAYKRRTMTPDQYNARCYGIHGCCEERCCRFVVLDGECSEDSPDTP